MSFLGDIVSSIGGEKAPAPPIKPPSRPSSTKPFQSVSSKPPAGGPSAKPVYKGTAGTVSTPVSASLKRKADDSLNSAFTKSPRPAGQVGSIKSLSTDSKLATIKPVNGTIAEPDSVVSAAPSKPPTKGSYAEMLARAKEAQTSKSQSQVGVIKHQASEKVKLSKVAERRREEQEKLKGDKNRPASRPTSSGKPDVKRKSPSPTRRGDSVKQAKGPRPPLHGPAAQYKGTMGTTPKNGKTHLKQQRKSRGDEYLGTDEEDEGDYDDYGDEDGYSDQSSDMEGGFDDLQAEEQRALRQARDDDARELALEQRLKKEKLDRKQKLQAMAAKRQ